MSPTFIKVAIGAALVAALWFYNERENSQIATDTRKLVEAEARERTERMINDVQNAADKARLVRRDCAERGVRYDFQNNKCIEADRK